MTQGSYWEGGPTLANPLRDGRLVDPAGRPVTQAVAITEEDIWIAHRWIADQNIHTQHRVLPKRLAEPINRLMKVVSDLQRGHDTDEAIAK